MTGLKIALPLSFTDTNLPILYDDPIICTGSLVLHDVGHSLGAFAGVPDNGGLIPNIAWKQANTLVAGSPGQSGLSGVIVKVNTGGASYPLIERTPKAGLHAIRSASNDILLDRYQLAAAASVLSYVKANSTHAYFASIWDNQTRAFTTTGSPFPALGSLSQNTGNFLYYFAQGTYGAGSTVVGSYSSNGYGLSTGIRLLEGGCSGGITGSLASATFNHYVWGGRDAGFSGYHLGGCSILYRCYFEDMTVSAASGGYRNVAGGITVAQRYAEITALEQSMFSAAFAAGGKFNGDTFTNPSGYP